MKALTKRIIRQVVGDKRSLMMIFVAPLLVLTLLHFLLGPSSYQPTIAVDGQNLPSQLVSALKEQDAHIVDFSNQNDAKQYLKDHTDVDAVLTISDQGMEITMYEADNKSSQAMQVIQKAMASVNPSSQLTLSYVVGSASDSFFDNMSFVFFGFLAFFMIFLISGMTLVKERSNGTLERILMTPITRQSVIVGYTCGYGVFAIVQAVLILLFGVYVLGVSFAGNMLWAILIMVLLAISAVLFGSLISVFANSELQVVQIVPVAIIPQVFFSGLIQLDTIPYGLGRLGYLTPVFYGCSALKEIIVIGSGFRSIWKYLLGLIVYILVLALFNTLALKKYRKL